MKRLRTPRVLSFLLTVVLSVTFVVSAPQQVHATPTPLQSNVTETSSYRPGLTNQPQSITVTVIDTQAPCVVPADTNIVSGTTHFSVTNTMSCQLSLNFASPTVTYQWNTGDSSTAVFGTSEAIHLADGSTQVTNLGSVTNGFAQGAIATRQVILPELDLTACSSPSGITQLSGSATLTFGP